MWNREELEALSDKVLGMVRREVRSDNQQGHLDMENWEWPIGVALYGIWKTCA